MTASTIGMVFFYKGNQFLIENQFKLVSEKVSFVSPMLTSGISSTLEDAQFLAEDPLIKTVNEVIDGKTDETFAYIEENLKTFLNAKKDILRVGLYVGSENVRSYMSVSRKGKESTTSTDEVYNLEHITKRKDYFLTPIKLYGNKKEPYIGVVVPIKNNNMPVGFLKIDLSMDRKFIQLRNDLDLKYSLYLFNSEGDYLYHPNDKKTFGFESGIRYQIQHDYPKIESFIYDKSSRFQNILKDKLFYLRKIPLIPSGKSGYIGLGISIPKSNILSQNIVLRKQSFLWTLFVMMMTTLIAWYFSRYITKNIKLVAMLAQEFARGRTDIEIDVKSKDEIGLLALSFQGMIRQVNERTRILKKSERETRIAKDQLESISRGKSVLLKDLRKQKDEIEKIGRDKDELLAVVSHDLKNPLAVIESAMDILQEEKDNLSDSDNELISRSKHSAKFALNLITDLLDMARLEGGIKLDYERFSVSEMIEDSILNFDLKAREKNIEFNYEFEDDFALLGDYGRIVQVICNIVGNSIKFTPNNGKITIKGSAFQDEGDASGNTETLKISISDTGPGIPGGKTETIFNKYEQARIKDREIGTGLGLTICKNIVELHNGKIWVESEEGKGATFIFTLPKVTRGKITNTANVPHIMLIDDNSTYFKELENSIVDNKYILVHSKQGVDAEELASVERVDLVLIDLEMPYIDGVDILKRLKASEHFKDTPFIIIAEAIKAEYLNDLNSLANDFVKKSDGHVSVINKISEYLLPAYELVGNQQIDINLPTVLVVDDDENVREIIVESLVDHNVNVIAAKSGLEAMFMIKKYPVNLVLTDLRMPEVDGLKLSQMIAEKNSHIQIILMSGTILELPAEVKKKFNIHSLIVKPFNVLELSENISNIAKQHKDYTNQNDVLEFKPTNKKNDSQRVLFVDDSEDMHMLFKVMMKKFPFEVTYCLNGQEALDEFKQNEYDLVLMDVNMPVMDGKKSIRLMREWEVISGKVSTIAWAITANDSGEEVSALLEAGFTDYMGKPINKEKIVQCLTPEQKELKSS